MSRPHARHSKKSSRYNARHARPAPPRAAAFVGTAAKAVPASLVIGAAGSAFALTGTASAATGGPATAAHVAAVQTVAARTVAAETRRAQQRSAYTVVSGDTLSAISARFCGTAADYSSLATASGISNPDMIYVGQHVKLDCHAAADPSPSSGVSATADDESSSQPAPAAAASSGGAVSTGGMSAFEACVISRESGGNAQAVNPVSGAGGLFQFLPSTWASLGYASAYPGGAQTAPASVQESAFAKLYGQAGAAPWSPYDGC